MKYFTRYSFNYPATLVYMLQASEYTILDYLRWWWRVSNFSTARKRKELVKTRKAKLLLIISSFLYAMGVFVLVALFVVASMKLEAVYFFAAAIWAVILPGFVAHVLVIPLWFGQVFIQEPRKRKSVLTATNILSNHPALKIAIAGSYGKTTAKEALLAVLSEEKNTKATPGNYNTPLGVCSFVQTLKGDEEVLIFELGESHVGDIKELSLLTQPDIGIITGINEAHLKTFRTIERTVATIFELADYLGEKPLYKNVGSHLVRLQASDEDEYGFTREGVGKWQTRNIETTITGTSFTLFSANEEFKIKTNLLGAHNVGIFTAVAAIANFLGVSHESIQRGIEKLKPIPHRLQPKELQGAWIIDDTYNGNIEGIEAGLRVLDSVEAKRKIYVTPGLVEQGNKTQEIHEKIGRLAAVVADEIVLMKNSTTQYIQKGIDDADFKGNVKIIEDPLTYYTNLDQVIAAGDVVLLQNDWTDNYA